MQASAQTDPSSAGSHLYEGPTVPLTLASRQEVEKNLNPIGTVSILIFIFIIILLAGNQQRSEEMQKKNKVYIYN